MCLPIVYSNKKNTKPNVALSQGVTYIQTIPLSLRRKHQGFQ